MRRILRGLLILLFILCLFGCNPSNGSNPSNGNDPSNGSGDNDNPVENKKLAYIPIDDRPVNIDRVKYLVGSLDYDIIMPDEDFYRTRLDNQPLNTNGCQYGNRDELINWLKNNKADYYVISLDQLLSGGLVNSRIMIEENMENSYKIIDSMLEVIGDKTAIIFDTVMRLASTVGYNGYGSNEYDQFRNYAIKARKALNGQELTIENIVNGYVFDETGKVITSSLSKTAIDNYLQSRERKLKISDYYLNKVKDKNNIYTYYGIDDSSPNITIQTNEIKYIKARLTKGKIFAGTDELGMMSVTKLAVRDYNAKVEAKVTYIGGMENSSADAYDIGSLSENVSDHLSSLGVRTTEDAELEILVLTKPTSNTQAIKDSNANKMITKINNNIASKIPTIVIDASSSSYYGVLQPKLVEEVQLGMLLGYSNWNTVGNAIGIALSNGISRYIYLKYDNDKTTTSYQNYLKTLTFSYIKDIAYRIDGQKYVKAYVSENVGSVSNFYKDNLDINKINSDVTKIMMGDGYNNNVQQVLNNLNNSSSIIDLIEYTVGKEYSINCNNFYFPWYRTFEISFDITLL